MLAAYRAVFNHIAITIIAFFHFVWLLGCLQAADSNGWCEKVKLPHRSAGVLSMGYKKDIFGIFAYEFELLPKNLEFSNLVGGGEPPSVDQWLHHFETAYKNHRDLFLGIYCYAFEQLSYDLLIILHRSVFQPVQNGIYIVES